jgi:hypothetical protein
MCMIAGEDDENEPLVETLMDWQKYRSQCGLFTRRDMSRYSWRFRSYPLLIWQVLKAPSISDFRPVKFPFPLVLMTTFR